MTNRPGWRLGWLPVLWVVAALGCGPAGGDARGEERAGEAVGSVPDGAPSVDGDTGAGAVRTSSDTVVPARPTPPTTIGSVLGGSEGDECIRGGTTRADVRSIMGEPDSVSFGVWLYGASQVAFGYGVVVEYRNVDGNLVLCP